MATISLDNLLELKYRGMEQVKQDLMQKPYTDFNVSVICLDFERLAKKINPQMKGKLSLKRVGTHVEMQFWVVAGEGTPSETIIQL